VITKQYRVKSDLLLNLIHFTPEANDTDPVLLCIHPTGFTSSMFACVAAHLRDMNIFGLDLRSHGDSERGDVTNWAFLAQDLKPVFSFMKEKTKHNKFFGIGISSGSSALLLHASKYSQDFKGLYICEPIVFPPKADLSTRELLANSARYRKDTFETKENVYERFSSKGTLSALDKSCLASYAKYGFHEKDGKVTLSCKKEDEEAIYLSGSENYVWDALASIRVRTQIVFGTKSDTMNLQKATEISHQIANSKVESLANVGHFTLFENPTIGAKSISSFIREEL
jgi:pimeloyl-ACP methyl ester carboxylesterase